MAGGRLVIVHILHHGRSLCGMPGVPRDWPTGNVWVSMLDRLNANCPSCLAEVCHCGRPLHYTDSVARAMVERLVADLGPNIRIQVADGRWYSVPRHYIALHGLDAMLLPSLGFEELSA